MLSAQRGISAVLSAAGSVPNVDPLAAFFVRARRHFGEEFEPEALIAHWASRSVGTLAGSDRIAGSSRTNAAQASRPMRDHRPPGKRGVRPRQRLSNVTPSPSKRAYWVPL